METKYCLRTSNLFSPWQEKPQNFISGQSQPDIKKYLNKLCQCCQNNQRCLTAVGASKCQMCKKSLSTTSFWVWLFGFGLSKQKHIFLFCVYCRLRHAFSPLLCFFPFPRARAQLKRTNKLFIIASNSGKPGCLGVWIWKLVHLWVQEGASSHLTSSSLGALRRNLQKFRRKRHTQGPLNSFRLSLLYQLVIFLTLTEASNIWVLDSLKKFGWNRPTGPKISSADIYRDGKAYFTRTS